MFVFLSVPWETGRSWVKVKLWPKCNLGFLCECTWVKLSCKSIIMTKAPLLRFTVFSFLGQNHFQWECYGHFYDSIKITIFKTLRRLDTTWNFASSITRVCTHEHKHWEHCLCTQILLKRTSLNNSLYQLFIPLAAILPVEKWGSTRVH